MTPNDSSKRTRPPVRQICVRCGADYEIGMRIHCDACGPESFLRSDYGAATDGVPLSGPADEFASYRDWLPFEFVRELPQLQLGCVPAPGLAAELGLDDLWLSISGFAPELGATLPTCTFKTLEAAGVMQRVLSYSNKMLILSSAGNAGTAVLEFGSRWNVPAIVIVPESAAKWMYTTTAPRARSPMLILLENATYPDAIAMVGKLVERFGDRVVREGGAFNVARRDSMGVPVLRAAAAIGRLPDHYFQAVGSGTGGIAAHEAALRLSAAGVDGGPMRLHLVQNQPFTPMHDAWTNNADEVERMPREEVLRRVSATYTNMLANATPPYAVSGGVREVLKAADGCTYAVSNDEARAGYERVLRHHEFAPAPEGGAALAGLVQAVARGAIPKGDTVLVHMTGGGWQRSIDVLGRQPYPVAHRLGALDVDGVSRAVASYLSRLEISEAAPREAR